MSLYDSILQATDYLNLDRKPFYEMSYDEYLLFEARQFPWTRCLIAATDYLELEHKNYYNMSYDERNLHDVRRASNEMKHSGFEYTTIYG